ncbi:MAG TPA: hypothetical protein VGG73_09245 [Vicinamibacterales bacterium]|jgi:hypothetical protein
MRSAVAGIAAFAVLAAGCESRTPGSSSVAAAQEARAATAAATTSGAAAGATSTIPHGDHNPKFGGLVLMNGDLHFEVVMHRDGSYRVFFSDAVRSELPAATASGMTVTVTRKSGPAEIVALHIDDSGESWTGQGRAVEDPSATVRIAYTARGNPYFIDVPFPR